MAVFTFIPVMGTKLAARINNAFALIKIGIVLFVFVVGPFDDKTENYQPIVPPSMTAASP